MKKKEKSRMGKEKLYVREASKSNGMYKMDNTFQENIYRKIKLNNTAWEGFILYFYKKFKKRKMIKLVKFKKSNSLF